MPFNTFMYATTIIEVLLIVLFLSLIKKFSNYPNRVFCKSTLIIIEVIALLMFSLQLDLITTLSTITNLCIYFMFLSLM